VRAARQGSLDGMCGVYAIVNALELVGVAGRQSPIHKALFSQLNYGLGAVALLTGMHEGLEPDELLRAANVAFHWLANEHGIELSLSRPFEKTRFKSVKAYVQALHELTECPTTAAIIAFQMPNMSHWSVVKEVGDDLICLRDSGRMAHLRVADFNLKRGPNSFTTADTLVVTLRAEPQW
jgi:hypothetical protein